MTAQGCPDLRHLMLFRCDAAGGVTDAGLFNVYGLRNEKKEKDLAGSSLNDFLKNLAKRLRT